MKLQTRALLALAALLLVGACDTASYPGQAPVAAEADDEDNNGRRGGGNGGY